MLYLNLTHCDASHECKWDLREEREKEGKKTCEVDCVEYI